MMRKKSKGQAIVELALVLPIFIFTFIGIFDFGRALHAWSNLNYQCMQAARVASKRIRPLIARNAFTSTTHSSLAEVKAAFWKYQSPLMPKDHYSNISYLGVGTSNKTVEVRATFNLTLYTPILGKLVGDASSNGALQIHADAKERKE